MSLRFPLLLHAGFYAALRQLPAARWARFRRLAAQLASGRWAGGTRVKKLRGVSKPVFEARQDGGDRVLFTLARSASPAGEGALATYLQVWDLVGHDGVEAAAQRINRSPDAEFLDYQELESETTAEPPPHPGASFDDVPPSAPGEAPGVLDLMLPPEDFRPREREDLSGAIRWYVLSERFLVEDGQWQALLDAGADELELKLTAAQYAVLRAPGPVLLSGSAGSGKTTIAVHRVAAAVGAGLPTRALYLTYSPWLRDHARRLYEALTAARGIEPVSRPDFCTVEELYRRLLGSDGPVVGRLQDYPEFARWYGGLFRRTDAALAWEEIRSIVKGACLDAGRPLLLREEYEALGRKRAPLFVSERPRLYEVALRWQERLRAGALADEIDLARLALARVRPADAWDHVICDEAQDLAEIQVHLLLRLHRSQRLEGLFLAGDPQQVINPSGFRWAEVRTAIRERLHAPGRPAPTLRMLGQNFRSVRGLVELANEVLAWKRERTGRSEGDLAEESAVAGATPVRVDGDEAALARAVAGFGPRCAVVVGSEEARDRLEALLDSTRIFTVPEAKGLEFDIVVLWGVLAADPGPWRRLLELGLDLSEDPAGRRALHHLYVAVTRARRHLAIFEPPEAPPVWTARRFATRLDSEPPASLRRLFAQVATPAEWTREAEYFLERGRPRQAAECFRRAGETRREVECLALHHERSGDLARAAALWDEVGRPERAARCYEEGALFAEAARCFAALGDTGAAGRCRARAAEQVGDWGRAALAWEALEAWEAAGRSWANAGQRGRQIECLARDAEGRGLWAEAASRWQQGERWDRAAEAWRRAGRDADARRAEAQGHEAGRRFAEAAAAWRAAGEGRRADRAAALAAEEGRRWLEAAPLWEALDDPAAAARAWKRAGRPREAALCEVAADLAAGRYARAAEALESMGDLATAAEAWQRAHTAEQRPARAAPPILPEAASEPWTIGGKPARLAGTSAGRRTRRPGPTVGADARTRGLACAVTAAEAASRFEEAEAIWQALGDPGQALRCRVARHERDGQHATAAGLLEARGLFEAAATAWDRAGEPNGRRRCEARRLEKRRRWDEAALRWAELGERQEAARCRGRALQAQAAYGEAADAFTEAGEAALALDMRLLEVQAAGDWAGAIALAEGAGRREAAEAIRSGREAWLAHGRILARRSARTRRGGLPPSGSAPRASARAPVQGSLFGLASAAPPPDLFGAVERSPGLRCQDLVALTGLPSPAVKAWLRAAVDAGRLVKTGATRGTRYWPAADRPGVRAPASGDPGDPAGRPRGG